MSLRLVAILLTSCALGSTAARAADDWPLVFTEDFEQGAARWMPTDSNAWEVVADGDARIFRQGRASQYKPPHRSPLNIALAKDLLVGDFRLDARVRSTARDYGHRDVCLFFGYQDPAHFYYVHLGKEADDHANQIFLVDGAPRVKISTTSTKGTPWDDQWHRVRIVRRVEEGTIEVYFDDFQKPAMTATDKHFTWGQIGVGSFDDTSDWDDIRVWGEVAEKPSK